MLDLYILLFYALSLFIFIHKLWEEFYYLVRSSIFMGSLFYEVLILLNLLIITVVSSNLPPFILMFCYLALWAKGDQKFESPPLWIANLANLYRKLNNFFSSLWDLLIKEFNEEMYYQIVHHYLRQLYQSIWSKNLGR